MKKLTTLTGVPVDEVTKKLAEPLPAGAFKAFVSKSYLTDINTGYMLERLTEVFGPYGLGWRLVYEPQFVEFSPDGKRVLASIKYAEFVYVLTDGEQNLEVPIITSGASTNDVEYALEGARTSAIGHAVKKLLFQKEIYKGQEDHNSYHAKDMEEKRVKQAEARKQTQKPPESSLPRSNSWTKEELVDWVASETECSPVDALEKIKIFLKEKEIKFVDYKDKRDELQALFIDWQK